MKLLMVSRWFWEERLRNGGRPGFLGELAQAVAGNAGSLTKDVELTVLSQAADAGLTPEPRAVEGISVHVYSRERRYALLTPLDKLVKPWGGYRKAVTDAAVIRRFALGHGPFDVIFAQVEEPDGLACALATLPGGMPPLVTGVQDLRFHFDREQVRFIRRSSFSFAFDRSERVLANSEQTAAWLCRHYRVPHDKIGQLRLHLTAPFLERAANTGAATPAEDQRILFLGALNVKKAPDVFLRAAALAAPELPRATFVLVGPETSDDFHFRSQLNELASVPALAGRVEMKGRLEPTGVIEEIRRARVVVCPSRVEAFSRTTTESLVLGRPVIVTETTGAADWVRSTGAGSIVPPGDPRALAAAMREWALKDRVPDASATIAAEFSVTNAADDLMREIGIALHAGRAAF
jgi:glycosyltransferase involved in cell wall biosynthesis